MMLAGPFCLQQIEKAMRLRNNPDIRKQLQGCGLQLKQSR
jgi:hypothetical protein